MGFGCLVLLQDILLMATSIRVARDMKMNQAFEPQCGVMPVYCVSHRICVRVTASMY